MVDKVDVAIIGAGSAGLSALRQVKQHTDNYVLIDQTPLGTTCARTGCMPSKALLYVARQFQRCRGLSRAGVKGCDSLSPDIPAILQHVRSLRDLFTNNMAETTKQLAGDKLIEGKAVFVSQHHLQVNDLEIEAEKIILATGARPKIPDDWKKLGNLILTTETLFEQRDLPHPLAVIGLGPIGLEIGQALSRLGLEIIGFDAKSSIAGTTDPAINEISAEIFKKEFSVTLDSNINLSEQDGSLRVMHGSHEVSVGAALVAIGVKPSLDDLGLEHLNIELDENGRPLVNSQTMQIGESPIFLAGDVNGYRPILHEALDEGYIAGKNSVSENIDSYCRRTPLQLVFSDPQIAVVGRSYQQLKEESIEFIVGQVDFQDQSRAVLELHNQGLLHVYAEQGSGKILGAEMVCPDAEHLSHLLAMAIQNQWTAYDILQTPFYHPTIEEAIRTAMLNITEQLSQRPQPQLSLCNSHPEAPLS